MTERPHEDTHAHDHEHDHDSHHHHAHHHDDACCDCCCDSGWDVGTLIGPCWAIGWLFTVGFAHLGFPKLLWAVVAWPYYLGAALSGTL